MENIQEIQDQLYQNFFNELIIERDKLYKSYIIQESLGADEFKDFNYISENIFTGILNFINHGVKDRALKEQGHTYDSFSKQIFDELKKENVDLRKFKTLDDLKNFKESGQNDKLLNKVKSKIEKELEKHTSNRFFGEAQAILKDILVKGIINAVVNAIANAIAILLTSLFLNPQQAISSFFGGIIRGLILGFVLSVYNSIVFVIYYEIRKRMTNDSNYNITVTEYVIVSYLILLSLFGVLFAMGFVTPTGIIISILVNTILMGTYLFFATSGFTKNPIIYLYLSQLDTVSTKTLYKLKLYRTRNGSYINIDNQDIEDIESMKREKKSPEEIETYLIKNGGIMKTYYVSESDRKMIEEIGVKAFGKDRHKLADQTRKMTSKMMDTVNKKEKK